MNNEQDIQEIARQLKHLHLQQSELIQRLGQLVENSNNPPTPNNTPREFAIGDRVRILNPGRFQTSMGIITKISPRRITIQSLNGKDIIRAPKNITLIE